MKQYSAVVSPLPSFLRLSALLSLASLTLLSIAPSALAQSTYLSVTAVTSTTTGAGTTTTLDHDTNSAIVVGQHSRWGTIRANGNGGTARIQVDGVPQGGDRFGRIAWLLNASSTSGTHTEYYQLSSGSFNPFYWAGWNGNGFAQIESEVAAASTVDLASTWTGISWSSLDNSTYDADPTVGKVAIDRAAHPTITLSVSIGSVTGSRNLIHFDQLGGVSMASPFDDTMSLTYTLFDSNFLHTWDFDTTSVTWVANSLDGSKSLSFLTHDVTVDLTAYELGNLILDFSGRVGGNVTQTTGTFELHQQSLTIFQTPEVGVLPLMLAGGGILLSAQFLLARRRKIFKFAWMVALSRR